jgi:hypothetical protein
MGQSVVVVRNVVLNAGPITPGAGHQLGRFNARAENDDTIVADPVSPAQLCY